MKIVDFIVREDAFDKTSSTKIRRFLYAGYGKPLESVMREAGL
jgi:hypothetical protein